MTHEAVWLDIVELRMAVRDGGERRIQALTRKRQGAHGFDREEVWDIDIEGLAAEMAAAKALGLPYNPSLYECDHEGDIAPGVQIRSTKYETGHLLVHDSDADDHLFILVIGRAPHFRLAGWCYARDAKHERFVRTHKGRTAYWMPQSELEDIRAIQIEGADALDVRQQPGDGEALGRSDGGGRHQPRKAA